MELFFNGREVKNGSTLHSYDAVSPNVSYSSPISPDKGEVVVLANIDTDIAYWFLLTEAGKKSQVLIPFTSPSAGTYLFMIFTPPAEGVKLKYPISAEHFRQQYRRSRPSSIEDGKVNLGTLVGSIKFTVDNELELIRNIDYVSGPSSMYYFNVDYLLGNEAKSKRFLLFGDIHGGKGGSCNVPCTTFPNNTANGNPNPSDKSKTKCTDIDTLLEELFTFSKEKGRQTDFFLEFPYKVDQNATLFDKEIELLATLTQDDQALWYSEHDHIPSLYAHFYPCFKQSAQLIAQDCTFTPQVRFQYSDIRQSHTNGPVILQTFLYISIQELNELMVALGDKTPTAKFKQNYLNQLETVNQLVRQLDDAKLLRFFDIIMNSTDYSNDIINYFKSFTGLNERTTKKLAALEQSLLLLGTRRYNKDYSRINAQLIELDREGVYFPDSFKRGVRKASEVIREFATDSYYRLLEGFNWSEWQIGYYYLNQLKPLPESWGHDFNLVTFDAIIMDTYVLARSFRSYTTPKYPDRNPGLPSELVVVYAGAAHSQNYARFFDQYLMTKPLEAIDRTMYGERCVHKEGLGKELLDDRKN